MGGFINPSTTISGTVAAPGIPLASSPLSGLYQISNGMGFAVSNVAYMTLDGFHYSLGQTTASSRSMSSVSALAMGGGSTPIAPLVLSPNELYLCSNQNTGRVRAFYRDPTTQVLSELNGSSFAGITGSPAIFPSGTSAFSRDSKSLYIGGDSLYNYRISGTTLTFTSSVAGNSRIIYSSANGLMFAGSNTQLLKSYSVSLVDGSLTLLNTLNVVGAVSGIAATRNGSLMAVSTGAGNLYLVSCASLGVMAILSTTATALLPADSVNGSMLFSDDGKFLYVAVFNSNAIQVFAVQPNYSLVAVQSTVQVGVESLSDFIGQSFIYAGGSLTINEYSRNPTTGFLTATGNTFGAGLTGACCVTSDGLYAFTGDAVNIDSVALTNQINPPLISGTFSSTPNGGLVSVNGTLSASSVLIAGQAPSTQPALASNGGLYLKVNNTSNGTAWGGVNTITPIAMAANVGAATVNDSGNYIFDITGALTAQGVVTLTFPTNRPAQIIFDNGTTGGFPLTANGGVVLLPGRSIWYWSGATLEAVSAAAVTIIQKSAVQVLTPADVTEDILATITLPAMKANDQLRIYSLWSANNNANAKTCRVRLGGIGGTAFESANLANNLTMNAVTEIANRNATNSQVGAPQIGYGLSTSAVVTSSIDVSAAGVTIVLTGQKAVAGDTLALETYHCELISNGS
jgi:hypothetical protein